MFINKKSHKTYTTGIFLGIIKERENVGIIFIFLTFSGMK